MKNFSVTILLNLVLVNIYAQDFNIKRIEFKDQLVMIHYDLLDSVIGRTYTMNVYASIDNFINPIQDVSGDVGLEVKPGKNKKITWDAKSNLGENFNGSVSLEVRGKLYTPFVRFLGFDDYRVIKRLKVYQITWNGGADHNILNFEVYKGDKKITAFPNIANVRHYGLRLPKDVKPGNDYRLKVTDAKNKDEVVYTGKFTVKRKTPLLFKVLSVAAIGYLVTLLSDRDSNKPKEIPDPITPN